MTDIFALEHCRPSLHWLRWETWTVGNGVNVGSISSTKSRRLSSRSPYLECRCNVTIWVASGTDRQTWSPVAYLLFRPDRNRRDRRRHSPLGSDPACALVTRRSITPAGGVVAAVTVAIAFSSLNWVIRLDLMTVNWNRRHLGENGSCRLMTDTEQGVVGNLFECSWAFPPASTPISGALSFNVPKRI